MVLFARPFWLGVSTSLLLLTACSVGEQGLGLATAGNPEGGAGGGAATPSKVELRDAGGGRGTSVMEPTAADAGGNASSALDAAPVSGGSLPTDAATIDLAPADGGSSVPPAEVAPELGKAVCPANEKALVLCLRFEDALFDESAPPAQVTERGLVYAPGLTGSAGRFDMDTDVDVAAAAGLGTGAFTIEAWLRPQRLPASGQRAGIVDRERHFGMFMLPGGDVECSVGASKAVASGALEVGQWSAVACTFDGSTVVAYSGGMSRSTAGGASLEMIVGQPDMAIGRNSPTGDHFSGLIDNVRLWNVSRTQAQICASALGCN